MAAIEIKGLSFAIGGKEILCDIDLSVEEGEYVSIVGPNGAGKTTLLRCIDRILTGTKGSIKVNGRAVDEYPRRELAKVLAYVPQADTASVPFTVHEFVMMGRYPHLSPFTSIRPHDEEVVREALEVTGVSEFAERYLGTLSSGERQKVLIAAALAQEAKVLLLDEPTTFLDYKHKSEIQQMLRHINRRSSVTVVSVTHDINTAALVSDRIMALRDGGMVFSGSPAEIMRNEVLEEIYGKVFVFAEHPETGLPVVVPEEVEA